jgi:uncharacterized protein (TIGR00730 family)
MKRVAVFGGSEPREGDPVYESAREVGRLLAQSGYEVVTGGYGGVMEGASRGAREGGGRALGVTCDAFGGRSPNVYLTSSRSAPDLHERTRGLVDLADAFVVLPGKSGTLAELTLLWALDRAGSLGGRPVILLGDVWRQLLRHLREAQMIEEAQLAVTRVVDSAEEAVSILSAGLASGR